MTPARLAPAEIAELLVAVRDLVAAAAAMATAQRDCTIGIFRLHDGGAAAIQLIANSVDLAAKLDMLACQLGQIAQQMQSDAGRSRPNRRQRRIAGACIERTFQNSARGRAGRSRMQSAVPSHMDGRSCDRPGHAREPRPRLCLALAGRLCAGEGRGRVRPACGAGPGAVNALSAAERERT